MDAILRVANAHKAFRSEPPVKPVDGLDLTVGAGQLVAITGVSGKGKSTLLNIMGGLLRPDEGTVKFKGSDLYALPAKELAALHKQGIGFVFQSPYLYQALTARENLVFAQKIQAGAVDEQAIDAALEEFGLTDRAEHLPCELSVGQRRRLVVARTLLGNHDVILADEPTNDLDTAWSDHVFDRFESFAAKPGHAVVVVTHDPSYARRADTAYVLEGGKLQEVKR